MFQSQQIIEERYTLEEQLESSSSFDYQTWLATDLSIDNVVILKVVALNSPRRMQQLSIWQHQIDTIKTLDHPRLANYLHYFEFTHEADMLPWFVCVREYIHGISLKELIATNQQFSTEEISFIATQVLEILEYLHQLTPPIIHNNIKPSNLIKSESQEIYLVDFDIFDSITPSNKDYQYIQSNLNAASEVNTDIYALGVTLIHLATGKYPVDLPQLPELVNLKPDLVSWIEKTVTLDPNLRFNSASLALQDLLKDKLKKSYRIKVTSTGHQKPKDTKISLVTTSQKLEVFFPEGGYRRLGKMIDPDFWQVERKIFGKIYGELYHISPLSLIIISLALMIFLVVIGLHVVAFLILFSKLLIVYKENIQLNMTRQTIEIIRQSLGIVYVNKQVALEDLQGIYLKRKDYIYEIVLETDIDTWIIGNALKKDECLWLIDKIQTWLELIQSDN